MTTRGNIHKLTGSTSATPFKGGNNQRNFGQEGGASVKDTSAPGNWEEKKAGEKAKTGGRGAGGGEEGALEEEGALTATKLYESRGRRLRRMDRFEKGLKKGGEKTRNPEKRPIKEGRGTRPEKGCGRERPGPGREEMHGEKETRTRAKEEKDVWGTGRDWEKKRLGEEPWENYKPKKTSG